LTINEDSSSRTALGSSRPVGIDFGTGEVIVEKISPQNTTRKFSSFSSKESQKVNIDGIEFLKSVKGVIYVSENNISCGNVTYPYNRILGLVRSNNNLMKSIEITLETISNNKRYHVKLQIITDNSDKLFTKLSQISLKTEHDLTRHTMKNQSNFLKDRFGLRRS